MWIIHEDIRINLNNIVLYNPYTSKDLGKTNYKIRFTYINKDYYVIDFNTQEDRDNFLKKLDDKLVI